MRSLLLSFLFLLISLFMVDACQAQCARWKKDHQYWQMRSGFGLLPTFAKDHGTTIIPPLSLELRYQASPTFSLGLLAGRSVSTVTREHFTGNHQTYQHDFRMLALRAGAHTHRWTKWHAYGGIVLGYQDGIIDQQNKDKEPNSGGPSFYRPNPSHFFFSAFMGSAYHPHPKFEIFGELSFGLSILTMGIGYSW